MAAQVASAACLVSSRLMDRPTSGKLMSSHWARGSVLPQGEKGLRSRILDFYKVGPETLLELYNAMSDQ